MAHRSNLFVWFLWSWTVVSYAAELDLVSSLKAEGQAIKPLSVAVPPTLKKLSTDYGKVWNESFQKLTFKEQEELKALVGQALDKDMVVLMLSGVMSPDNEDAVISQESRGLMIQRLDRFQPRNQFADRSHVSFLHSLPEVDLSSWIALRQEIASDKAPEGYFAGRPITDYCAADVGRGVPRNAATNISVLDISMVEATKTGLELSLLHLLDQPDAFPKNNEDSAEQQDSEAEHAWQLVLKRWLTREHSKKLKLSDMLQWWKGVETLPSPSLRKFARNLASTSQKFQKLCHEKKGKWREAATSRRLDSLTVFSCSEVGRSEEGFELFVEQDSEFDEITALVFETRKSNKSVEFRLDASDRLFPFEVKVFGGGSLIADKLYYDAAGLPRGKVDITIPGTHYGWNEQGKVVWSGRVDAKGIWQEDLTWNAQGLIVSRMMFTPNGDLKRLIEWHDNGNPSRSVSFERSRPDGLEQWWYVSGQPSGEVNWYAGKKFGSARVYFENGVVAYDGSYIDDQLDGPLTWRDEQGREVLKAIFRFGNPDGMLQIKNGENVTLASAVFDRGRVEGIVTVGVDGGRSGAKLPFKSGVLDGEAVFLDASGKQRLLIPYRSGKIQGEVKGYYGLEKPAVTCMFDEGNMTAWSVFPSKEHNVWFQVQGSVKDRQSGAATLDIKHSSDDLSVRCQGRDEIWSDCRWTFLKKSHSLNKKQIQFPKLKGKNSKSCKVRSLSWDLTPLIEQDARYAFVEVLPNAGCVDARHLGCRVELKNGLFVKSCEPLDDDEHDHDHAHDHNHGHDHG